MEFALSAPKLTLFCPEVATLICYFIIPVIYYSELYEGAVKMKRIECSPCLWMWINIKQNRNPSKYYIALAAILKGIAAFFISTNLYKCIITITYYNIFLLLYAVYFVITRTILFKKTADKPCFSPGCRSPPFLIRF